MCGNVGVAGGVLFKQEEVFKQLLIVDSLRGEHSTGVASVSASGGVSVAKRVGDPFTLFDSRDWNAIRATKNTVLIGHNRYATTGAVTRGNAHPFEFDTLVGCHNGTLTNKLTIPNGNKYSVDSEVIFHNIEEIGTHKAISQVSGAWALVWWNKKDNTLNFLRNKERSLFFTFSPDEKTIYWASEEWMLVAILERNSLEFNDIVPFDIDTHYCLHIEPSTGAISHMQKTVCKGKSEEQKKYPVGGVVTHLSYIDSVNTYKIVCRNTDSRGVVYLELEDICEGHYDVRLYNMQYADNIGDFIRGRVIMKAYDKQGAFYHVTSNDSPVHQVNEKKDRYGNVISAEDLAAYYNYCVWCSSPIDLNEDNHFISKEVGALCHICKKVPEVVEYL